MNKIKKLTLFFLAFVMVWGIAGCNNPTPPPADPLVTKIEVSKEPDKAAYFVGEEFSAAGGKIKVFYNNDTTAELEMTAAGVTIDPVSTDVSGEEQDSENLWKKTVTVRYAFKSDKFDISVSYERFTFIFDYGYDDMKDTSSVNKGSRVEEPEEAPQRVGYKFNGWYIDANYSMPCEFPLIVTKNTTVYCQWLLDTPGDVYFQFTFDYNFYGGYKTSTVKQTVKEGEKAIILAVEPNRTGYQFAGWFSTADGTGSQYSFDLPVTANKTVYAKWTKISEGTKTYTFEAEKIDLKGKTTPGYSNYYSEGGMVFNKGDVGASGGRYVVGLYENGNYLDFCFASDIDVADATLVLRLSAEMRDMVLDSELLDINTNYGSLNYDPISLTGVPPMTGGNSNCLPFADFEIAVNFRLDKGPNRIRLMSVNHNPLSGTTITAIGPLVDCVKITTSAILTWDAVYDLPKQW